VAARIVSADAPRILPDLDDRNRPFWTGGRYGQLLIQRCTGCQRWVHPPTDACPACGGQLLAAPVSGRGTVFTFTVNAQQFVPNVPLPYIIAIVQLDEQDDLRVPANLVNCDPDVLDIGMAVQVLFEDAGEVFVPLFEPVSVPA
jgi:uncharacterized protein